MIKIFFSSYLIWVNNPFYLWLSQVIVAIVSMLQTIIIFYLSFKVCLFDIFRKKLHTTVIE